MPILVDRDRIGLQVTVIEDTDSDLAQGGKVTKEVRPDYHTTLLASPHLDSKENVCIVSSSHSIGS